MLEIKAMLATVPMLSAAAVTARIAKHLGWMEVQAAASPRVELEHSCIDLPGWLLQVHLALPVSSQHDQDP